MHSISGKTSISSDQILGLIEVQRPYFALSDLHLDLNGWLVAKAPVECPSSYETCLMNASEAGRHLAILGSCSGALINERKAKHYYLANHAILDTYPAYVSHTRPEHLYTRAKAAFASRRDLHAVAELMDISGALVARLQVDYHVLPEKSFYRLYGSNVCSAPPAMDRGNPYLEPVRLDILYNDDFSLKSTIGTVTRSQCAGHFDGVKSLPVAILSQCFLNSSYIFLRNRLGKSDQRFVLKSCVIEATKLATAGQRIIIDVDFLGLTDGLYMTRCIARNHFGETIGEMICNIESLVEH